MLNTDHYLDTFKKAAQKLDKRRLKEKEIDVYVGITLDSVVMKLYKKKWANDQIDTLNSRTRIFFSIWLNDDTLKKGRLFYNIHALKLREFKGLSISSTGFAREFRNHFKKFEHQWEHVSTKFGPLTLMEGWIALDVENLENNILVLANNFLKIDSLVDITLKTFEKIN